MDFYVYILRSVGRTYYYVGFTSDLSNRLKRHDQGREKTTKFYRPFKLVHVELADTRGRARVLEKYFKSGYGREIIKEIDNGTIVEMAELADAHA